MTETAVPIVGTATARMTRVLFLGAALTGIAFSALNFSHTIAQTPYVNLAWETVVATVLWSLPIVIAVLSPWAPLPLLRGSAIALVVLYCAAVSTWPIAQVTHRIPDGSQPWIINLVPMVVFAGALVLPALGAWIFLVVMCAGVGVLRFIADGSQNFSTPIQNTLFNIMYLSFFVGIIIVTRRAGLRRDEAARRIAEDDVIAAASAAQNLERATVAALTHDEVISTLIAAARSSDASAPLVPRYATRALQRLDALGAAENDPYGLAPAHALISSLRETVTALADNVSFSTVRANADAVVPNRVLRAFNDATAEAVRNSVRHANRSDRPVSREVSVSVTNTDVVVDIVDDGAGFDAATLSSERYGIRLSIVHRMSLLEGGSAAIDSKPGEGTRIRLTWTNADKKAGTS